MQDAKEADALVHDDECVIWAPIAMMVHNVDDIWRPRGATATLLSHEPGAPTLVGSLAPRHPLEDDVPRRPLEDELGGGF